MDNRTIIQQSLDYIENNLQTQITAAELADMAGFSLFHSDKNQGQYDRFRKEMKGTGEGNC